MRATIQDKILQRIKKYGPGSVFIPQGFLDLGRRAAVDQALCADSLGAV